VSRPCSFCVAVWAGYAERSGGKAYGPTETDCEWEHRDDPRVYDLARAMAKVMQDRRPSDEQIGWFLADADEVVDDFGPAPDRWRVRRLSASAGDAEQEILVRLRINDVTYVVLEGGKDTKGSVVKLATFRSWSKS
jgi:hypothetical protein